MHPAKKEEFKRPLSKSQVHALPLLALPSSGVVSPRQQGTSPRAASVPAPPSAGLAQLGLLRQSSPRAEKSTSAPDGLRASLTKSEAPRKSGSAKKDSPMAKKAALLPGSSVYSPRWIVSVKRETDKQVTAFLVALASPEVRESVSPAVLEELERQGETFLHLKMEMLGPKSKAMVRSLQQLLRDTSPKEKKLVVQLMLAISSCSRLDEYIECVREAEKNSSAALGTATAGPTRHGYDGQIEYVKKTDSPRLRDSASKRANFLSVSLNGDDMEAFIQLIPSSPPPASGSVRQPAPPLSRGSGDRASGTPDSQSSGGGSSSGGGEEDSVLCRVCENMIERSICDEHVKYCKKKVGHDIEVLTVDQKISQLLPTLKAGSPLRLLMEKVLSVSAQQGGFCECSKVRNQLDKLIADKATGYPEDAPELQRCRELTARKNKSLQSAEIAVLQSPRLPSPSQSRTPLMERHSSAKIPSILDFEILKPIARGGYGGVYLARKKVTHDLYAIKALNRKEMIRRGEMKSIFAERNIMASVHSDHVVKMFFAMASRKYLFFVMEFMAGGDLFSLLRKFGRLEEETAKFYVAEVVLALEDLHKQGVIHRDLKPDNILIGADGHVKLADFGLSAMGLINKQARDGADPDAAAAVAATSSSSDTNVVAPDGGVKGTPHYLAPEVLLGLPHTQAMDWWALGVLLFEFINGYPPFDGETVQEVFSEIFAGSINWPASEEDMSRECKDLIRRLLDNDPEKRLHDAIKVKAHPFFVKDDPDFWLTLHNFEPPYVPTQASEEDTSAFDERIEFFPIEGDSNVGKDRSSDSGSSSDSSDEDSSSAEDPASSFASAGKGKKDSAGLSNFWHVSVQNLGALNAKK